MTAPDLKPCPFCGGDKNTICKTDYKDKDSFAVSCRYHICHGAIFMLGYGYFPTADQAIAAWNTRAVDPAAIREAALREAVETAEAKLAKAMDALRLVTDACDEGKMVSLGAGGMSIEAQIRSSAYQGVPAWPIEEARATLAELEKTE